MDNNDLITGMTEAQAQEIIFNHFRMDFVQQENGRYRFTVDGDHGFHQPEGQPPVEFLVPDIFHPTSMAVAYVIFMFAATLNGGIDLLFKSTLGARVLTEYSAWQAAIFTIATSIKGGRMDNVRIDWDGMRETVRKEKEDGEL